MTYAARFMSASKPLYSLGDLIAFYWESEDGLEFGLAYITGIEYQPPGACVSDWWYAIRQLSPVENTDYDVMPERDIMGRVIHGT